MDKGFWFWLIYVICLIFGIFFSWPEQTANRWAYRPIGWTIVVFILIGLLGWKVFGPPIQ